MRGHNPKESVLKPRNWAGLRAFSLAFNITQRDAI
jgi:hypothetical protein